MRNNRNNPNHDLILWRSLLIHQGAFDKKVFFNLINLTMMMIMMIMMRIRLTEMMTMRKVVVMMWKEVVMMTRMMIKDEDIMEVIWCLALVREVSSGFFPNCSHTEGSLARH